MMPATVSSVSIGPSRASMRLTMAVTAALSRHVADLGVDLRAAATQVGGRLLERVGVAGADHHAVSAVGELAGDEEPQAAGAAGHEGQRCSVSGRAVRTCCSVDHPASLRPGGDGGH